MPERGTSHAIQTFDNTAAAAEVAAATLKDGAAIVSELVPESLTDVIAGDLRQYMDQNGHRSRRRFVGFETNRCHHVLDESESAAQLVAHDLVMGVADEILLPHCESYRVGSMTAIEVDPGQKAQYLHRDNCIYPVSLPGLEMVISVMWSLTDFTMENGATQVVPGSHRHISMGEDIDKSNVQQAVMPKGSALFYLGSTVHSAGENRSDSARMGLINTYSLGWLRSEVNQYLHFPLDVVRKYDERMRCLLGFTTHDRLGDRLGKYYGSDSSFIDKDDYALNYRPYPLESESED